MEHVESREPHFPAPGDVRGLIAAVNDLHATAGHARPQRMTEVLAGVFAAAASRAYAISRSDPRPRPCGQTVRRAVEAAAELETVPFHGPGTELRTVAAPSGSGPRGTVSVRRDGRRATVVTVWREPPLTDAESAVLGILHGEIVWAFDDAFAMAGLPPATRPVLELMIRGLPEKKIAERLGRSFHTVHTHVKKAYKHFGVNSRGELIARLYERRGDSGPRVSTDDR